MDTLEYNISWFIEYIVPKVSLKHRTEQWYEMNVPPLNVNGWAECQIPRQTYLFLIIATGEEMNSVESTVMFRARYLDLIVHDILY